jgi:probable addiction module antidote protein
MPVRDYKEGLFSDLQDANFAAEYLNSAIEDGDLDVLLLAVKNVIDARGGMSEIAKSAGVNRESLYRSLTEGGNPKINTLHKILHALGLKLAVEVENDENHAAA